MISTCTIRYIVTWNMLQVCHHPFSLGYGIGLSVPASINVCLVHYIGHFRTGSFVYSQNCTGIKKKVVEIKSLCTRLFV